MDIKQISTDYFSFIENNTHFTKFNNDLIEVTTPFVDSFGDGISFVIEHDGRFLKVSDQGFTIWNLSVNGVDLSNKQSNRNAMLDSILRYSGCELSKDNIIYKKATKETLSQAIHEMSQVLLNIYDFAFFSKKKVINYFIDDVKQYFASNRGKYQYFSDFSIIGKSHLSYKIDFVFLKNNQTKLVNIHNTLNKQQVNNILVSWLDTVEKRKMEYPETESLSIILSEEGYESASEQNMLALGEYGINVFNFADKKVLKTEFGK